MSTKMIITEEEAFNIQLSFDFDNIFLKFIRVY